MGPLARSPEHFKGSNLKIGVIGCGYVGLPLLLRFAEHGHRVWGFDTDPAKIEKLSAGQSYVQHIPAEEIKRHVDLKRLSATGDFSKLREVEAILICVPTPLDDRREPDRRYVEQTAHAVAENFQPGQLVVLESTTYPGTTEELLIPILERSGLHCPISRGTENEAIATDFYLAFSSEREDPGSKKHNLGTIPKVSGVSPTRPSRGAEPLFPDRAQGHLRQLDAGSGNDQAARKHLSMCEYCVGE